MQTRFKIAAVAVLAAAFAGASAEEAPVEEMVVVGERTAQAPELAAEPSAPQVRLERVAPKIELPAVDIELPSFSLERS